MGVTRTRTASLQQPQLEILVLVRTIVRPQPVCRRTDRAWVLDLTLQLCIEPVGLPQGWKSSNLFCNALGQPARLTFPGLDLTEPSLTSPIRLPKVARANYYEMSQLAIHSQLSKSLESPANPRSLHPPPWDVPREPLRC